MVMIRSRQKADLREAHALLMKVGVTFWGDDRGWVTPAKLSLKVVSQLKETGCTITTSTDGP